MNFAGFQKMTLLDYPGRVACTLFTKGCNFLCPFCHNALLVTESQTEEQINEEVVLSYLKKRQGILDGVCITGGEPLLHAELEDFLRKLKTLGYSVKLDTNGSRPERLEHLVSEGLVDYVAMDVKNTIEKYAKTVGLKQFSTTDVEKSIDFLLKGTVSYEFRTTIVKEYHTVDDVEAIAKRIVGAPQYFLQNFVDSGCLIGKNLHAVTSGTMEKMQKAAAKHLSGVFVRGL